MPPQQSAIQAPSRHHQGRQQCCGMSLTPLPLDDTPDCHVPHVQVLSRDIRSVHQRLGVGSRPTAAPTPPVAARPPPRDGLPWGAASAAAAASSLDGDAGRGGATMPVTSPVGAEAEGWYHVVLEGVDVSYDIDSSGGITVRGAAPAAATGEAEEETGGGDLGGAEG